MSAPEPFEAKPTMPGEKPPSRRSTDREINPLKKARRWQIALIAVIAVQVAGFFAGRASVFQTKEEQRIAAAVADAPTKEQVRFAQRLSEVEGSLTGVVARLHQVEVDQRANTGELRAEVRELSKAVRDLTIELKTKGR